MLDTENERETNNTLVKCDVYLLQTVPLFT